MWGFREPYSAEAAARIKLESLEYEQAIPSNKFPEAMYAYVGASIAAAPPLSEQDALLFWRDNDLLETSRYWRDQLDLSGYTKVCSLVPISIFDWIGLKDDWFYQKHGLPDQIKEALKSEVEIILQERQKIANERLAQDKFDNQIINNGMGNFIQTTALDRLGR